MEGVVLVTSHDSPDSYVDLAALGVAELVSHGNVNDLSIELIRSTKN